MSLLVIASIIIIVLYVIVIATYTYGWLQQKETTSLNTNGKTFFFSIIIPFKNEEKNLPFLLNDLSHLSYSKSNYDIIFIDDDSDDNSNLIVRDFIKAKKQNWYLHSSTGGKKKALEKGIGISKNKYIITIDADCRVPVGILLSYTEALRKRPSKMIAGPVTFVSNNSIWGQFAELEFISLIGSGAGSIAIGKPIMLNGANLLFERKLALEAGGEVYNSIIASGDDIFLMHYLVEKYGAKELQFLKDKAAIVTTPAPSSLKAWINQRLRWTAKARGYKINYTSITALVILAFNLLFMFSFLLLFIEEYRRLFIYLFLIKTVVDFPLLFSVSKFMNQQDRMRHIVFFQIIYPFYIVLIGIGGLLSKEKWKN